MTISIEARIDTISRDVRIAASDIQAGKLVDLIHLESRIKDVCHAVSDKKRQLQVADQDRLHRGLTALMDALDNLEKMVAVKKECLDPPTSSLETA